MKKYYFISIIIGIIGVALITTGIFKMNENTTHNKETNTNTKENINNNSDENTNIENNSMEEKIIKKENAKDSKKMLTEKEAKDLFEERGFNQLETKSVYTSDGEYIDEAIIEPKDIEHPMYETMYLSPKQEMWTIYIIEDQIYAYAVSYSLESESGKEYILSESDEITSYDSENNVFITAIPSKEYITAKKVDKIDSETLNNYIYEEE